MKTQHQILLLFCLLAPSWAVAQPDPTELEAYNIVQEILITMGEAKNPIKIKVVSSTGTQNAKAIKSGGERIILYNRDFLSDFNRSGATKQRAYFILGHEVGHHIHNDDFGTTNSKLRREMELKADGFAGRLFYRLGIEPKEVAPVLQGLPSDTLYPPVNQRMMAVMEGYEQEKKDWERVGKSPRDGEKMDPPMNLQRRYKTNNKAEGVSARIFHDSILIRFNVYPLDNKTFEGRFALSDKAKAAPELKNFKWLSSPENFGAEKTAVWYFKKDGFSYSEVFNGDNFGLAIFVRGKVPEAPKKWRWWVGGLLSAGGAALLASGIPDRISAQQDYNQYKSITKPSVFSSITGMTRQQAYNQFNPLKKSSEWRIGIGAGLFVLGGCILLNTNKKRRNFPKDIFLFKGNYP